MVILLGEASSVQPSLINRNAGPALRRHVRHWRLHGHSSSSLWTDMIPGSPRRLLI